MLRPVVLHDCGCGCTHRICLAQYEATRHVAAPLIILCIKVVNTNRVTPRRWHIALCLNSAESKHDSFENRLPALYVVTLHCHALILLVVWVDGCVCVRARARVDGVYKREHVCVRERESCATSAMQTNVGRWESWSSTKFLPIYRREGSGSDEMWCVPSLLRVMKMNRAFPACFPLCMSLFSALPDVPRYISI